MRLKILSRRTRSILIGLLLFIQSSILSGSALANNIDFAPFSDVPSTHPNSEAIDYVQAQAIVEGYPDGTFRPDKLINRAEFTKIIIGAQFEKAAIDDCIAKNTEAGWPFVFFPDVTKEAWFAKYICVAKMNDIVKGYPDGTFKPANDINFSEASKIIVNAFGIPVETDAVWYKPFVEKLGLAHAIPTTIATFDQKLTRGEMAEMVYRLKADLTTRPSKTYQSLLIENTALLPGQEQTSSGLPVRIKIPGIHVDSAVEYVGLTPQGAVGVPKDPLNAAWYDLGPLPGDEGSSVITGHVNWYYGAKGVFENLNKVRPGDKIEVQNDKGEVISFVVREIRDFDPEAVATDVFISDDGKAHLNIITCEGTWDSGAKQYTQRLVVFADREEP